MKARAGAIDELMASGALTDALGGPPPDDIQAELDRMGATQGVDAELERMKAELAGGGAPKQIEGSGQTDSPVGQPSGTSFQKEQPGSGGA
jgi:phage shock protein A